jgi:hypothetical protein
MNSFLKHTLAISLCAVAVNNANAALQTYNFDLIGAYSGTGNLVSSSQTGIATATLSYDENNLAVDGLFNMTVQYDITARHFAFGDFYASVTENITGTFDTDLLFNSNTLVVTASVTSTCSPLNVLGGQTICSLHEDDNRQNTSSYPFDVTSALLSGNGTIESFSTAREVSNLPAFGSYALTSQYTVSEVPIPAAAWLFGSALMTLIGIKKQKA